MGVDRVDVTSPAREACGASTTMELTPEIIESLERKYGNVTNDVYRMDKLRAMHIADELTNYVNAFGFDRKTFAETLGKQHRTNQQSVMRAFVEFVTVMANFDAEERYDGRNEASCKLASKFREIAYKHALPLV